MAKQKPQPQHTSKNNLPPGEEEILKKNGVKIVERRLATPNEIDWERSARNQARLKEPIIQDHVDDMALALIDEPPAILPDLILCDDGGKKLVIWSGNNRGAAYKAADIKEFWVVIVKCNDAALLDMMPRMFNRAGGEKLKKSESMLHAIYSVKTYGWIHAQAAAAFGVSEGLVGRHMRITEIREHLESLNVKTGSLSDAHMLVMAPIDGNDHVLEKVCRIALDASMNSNQLGAIVREVKAGKTESAQLEIAKQLYQEYVGSAATKSPAKVGKRSKATALRSARVQLMNLLIGVSSVKQLEVTDKEQIATENKKLEELAVECLRVAAGKARRRKPPA